MVLFNCIFVGLQARANIFASGEKAALSMAKSGAGHIGETKR